MTCDNTQFSFFGTCIPKLSVLYGTVAIGTFYLLGQTEQGRKICHDLKLLDCIQPTLFWSAVAGLGAYYFTANRFKKKLCSDPNFVNQMNTFKSTNTTNEIDLMKYYLF